MLEEAASDLCATVRAKNLRLPPEKASELFVDAIATVLRLNLDRNARQALVDEFVPQFVCGLCEQAN